MRIPLASSLESRDGTTTKDAKCKNAIIEVAGEKLKMRKRPGISDSGLVRAGAAQFLGYWNSQTVSIIDDYINVNTSLFATNVTTWNGSDKGGDITLSNGDLTATWSGGAYDGVRSTTTKSAGYWYWEVTLNATASVGIGLANLTENVDDATVGTTTANAIAYYSTGVIQFNNVNVQTSLATATTNDVIGVLYNVDADTLQFYKNGAALGTLISSLPSGVLYAYLSGNSTAPVVTANFGATSFSNPPSSSSTLLAVSTADLPFSGQDNGSNAPEKFLMVKNAEKAWAVSPTGGVEAITDVDYPGTYAVTLTSLTRSGSVATATTATDTNFQVGSSVVIAGATPSDYNGAKVITSIAGSVTSESAPVQINITRSGTTATATTVSQPHGFTNGQLITIAGANQAAYNGTFTITWISATSFSFTVTVSGSVTSPATGTLVADLSQLANGIFPVFASASGGTMTVTWPGHSLATGAYVTLYSPVLGLDTAAITVSDASTFTMTTSLGGGTFGSTAATAWQYLNPSVTISSITTTDSITATVTFSGNHLLSAYRRLIISGANQAEYNTDSTIGEEVTVTGATTVTYPIGTGSGTGPATPATGTITARRITNTGASFTFNVSGSPTTPATGTITATGGRNTVPGIIYLDGYFVVMDVNGVVYNSGEDDPTSWNALEYFTALAAAGAGKALGRVLNYGVAFKEYSTEFFFTDPQSETGSPFSPAPSLFTQVGCVSGFSLADVSGSLLWISQSKAQKGRSVHMMAGTQQVKVSSPDVDRIVTADSLSGVYAYGVTLDGHPCYVLTLTNTGITLIYDLDTKAWSEWTSYTLGSSKSITSITLSGTTATVTFGVAHTLSDGDPVLIAGANQAAYNGIQQATYVSTTVITFETTAGTTTPATGTITGTPYTESYFKFSHYTNAGGTDTLLHESDGHLYAVSSSLYRDAGLPVNYFARVKRLDLDSLQPKKNPRIGVIGTSVSDTAMIRYSDDDCATYGAYRRVTLSDEEPMLRRNGAFKRRTYEFRHVGNTAPVIEALELEIK
jgi:hypothetical protein